jgi:hypothetical protein
MQCGSLRAGGYQDRQELQIEFYDWIECSTETELPNKYSYFRSNSAKFRFLLGFARYWRKLPGILGCGG